MKRISIAIALMMVALLMGCNLELVDTSIFEEIEEENQAGLESGFAGGNGTEASPFLIESEAQFNLIADYSDEMKAGQSLYFDVVSDLDFTITPNVYIPYFRGDLDFTGHTLKGVSQERQGATSWGMIGDFIEGTVSNLIYEPVDYIPIIAEVNFLEGNQTDHIVELNNISTNGTIFGLTNNDGLFVNCVHGGTLRFVDCVNNANLYGTTHCGIFVGGYAENTVESLEYVRCVNNGTLISKYAGMYYGNSAHVPQKVTITDCMNNGNIIALAGGKAGVFGGTNPNSDNAAALEGFEKIAKAGTSGNGKISTQTETITASYSDNKFTVFSAPEGTAVVEIVGSVYTTIFVNGTATQGTFMFSVSAEEAWEGSALPIDFPKYQAVDSKYSSDGTVTEDKYGNKILDGQYYVIEAVALTLPENSECVIIDSNGNHIAKNMTFTAYAFDAEGIPLAFAIV